MTALSHAATQRHADSASTRPAPKKKEWTPHIWEGADFFAWLRLFIQNRGAVDWSKLYVAAAVTPASVFNSTLRLFQEILLRRRMARTPRAPAPLFILGHWRTGTTYLHELLIRDPRHAYPTTYECLAPGHFLISSSWIPKIFWWFVPTHRPMDNMPAGWDRPQEDEFALCLLGAPSPYAQIAFPNRQLKCHEDALDLRNISRSDRERWRRLFLSLMRCWSYRNGGKRLILKSPPHTARIPELVRLFPEARFVHIVRDPYVVFPSTLRLWKSLYTKHGLQKPTFAGLEDLVLRTFVRMYERLEEGRKLLAPNRFTEVRYEDLIRDPIGQLRSTYDRLELGDFEPASAPVAAYLATVKDYETNRYELTPAHKQAVTRHWHDVVRGYGYSEPN